MEAIWTILKNKINLHTWHLAYILAVRGGEVNTENKQWKYNDINIMLDVNGAIYNTQQDKNLCRAVLIGMGNIAMGIAVGKRNWLN